MWDINRQPIPYMDRLLNANLAPTVQQLPGCEDRIRSVLLRNRETFTAKLRALGIQHLSPAAIHRALETRILAIESQLARNVQSGESLERRGSRRGACRRAHDCAHPRSATGSSSARRVPSGCWKSFRRPR